MSTVLLPRRDPGTDPPPVTETRTSGCAAIQLSAQASARLTRVSEPVFWILSCSLRLG